MSLKAFSESGKCPPSPECIKACVLELSSSYDKEYGGFGNAPKFPQPGKIFLTFQKKFFLTKVKKYSHCKKPNNISDFYGFFKIVSEIKVSGSISYKKYLRYSPCRKYTI